MEEVGTPATSWVRTPRGRLALRIAFIAGVFALALLIYWNWDAWRGGADEQTTDDAYLQSDFTPVGAKVSGYVLRAPAEDYTRVERGAVLVELVADDYKAALLQAEAGVATARAAIATLAAQSDLQDANIAAARAVIDQTRSLNDRNAREIARQRKLATTGATSDQTLEVAGAAAAQSAGQLAQNRAQLAAAERQKAVLKAQVGEAEAKLASAKAALYAAQLNLGYTRVLAPAAGTTGQRLVKPGQYVAPGQQVATLVPSSRVWVIANFKETQLRRMKVGQRATLKVDAYPDLALSGRVEGFAPASSAQFALLPPDNASGNFTKVVQRLAVKIAIDDAAKHADRLRPGLSVVATVHTDARP